MFAACKLSPGYPHDAPANGNRYCAKYGERNQRACRCATGSAAPGARQRRQSSRLRRGVSRLKSLGRSRAAWCDQPRGGEERCSAGARVRN